MLSFLSRHLFLASLFQVCFLTVARSSTASHYAQVPGLIDIRTTFSDGDLAPDEVVKLASDRGFEVVVFNDHDRMVMEYGVWPFRNVFKKRVERNSINKRGAEPYLNALKETQQKFPDMIVIPGSITAPFYYWSGSYLKDNLTAHDHERRLLTIGLEDAQDYENLPILHNGFSTEFTKKYIPHTVGSVVGFLVGLFLLTRRRPFKIIGVSLCLVSALFVIDTNPFRSSPFDQYHGDKGIAPYQLVIDHVASQGGLTFWNYPETHSGIRRMGPIRVDTPPFPEVLKEAKRYTGFAALYGDNITVTEPGNLWDRVLLEYCMGKREKPVWSIATADFHKEGAAGEKLGNFPTIFLVRDKTKKAIFGAMEEGRMYACRGQYPQRLVLKEFSVHSQHSDTEATCGEHIEVKGAAKIQVVLDSKEKCKNSVSLRLIRSGQVVKTLTGQLPMQLEYEDKIDSQWEKIYYRIDAKGCGALVANPIFVSFIE